MKDATCNLMETTAADFISERVKTLEQAINTNNFNNFMDAILEYGELEKSMKNNGYPKQVENARRRIYNLIGYCDFGKMRFKD